MYFAAKHPRIDLATRANAHLCVRIMRNCGTLDPFTNLFLHSTTARRKIKASFLVAFCKSCQLCWSDETVLLWFKITELSLLQTLSREPSCLTLDSKLMGSNSHTPLPEGTGSQVKSKHMPRNDGAGVNNSITQFYIKGEQHNP